MRRSEHIAGFALALLLVILGGRAIAYAATPTPLAAQLGGPRLPVITDVAPSELTIFVVTVSPAAGVTRPAPPPMSFRTVTVNVCELP